MRLRSREQAVPSPLRKRTRSAINSRSSSRSSSVSQISNTSSRSKRARIVSPDRSECKVAKRKVAKARITRSKQGTSSPLVKTPSKRGRPLKRPRVKSPVLRTTPPSSPAHPPEAASTPEQQQRTLTKRALNSPPHKQAKVETDREEVPIATIQTTKSSELEDEVLIASVSEPNLDDSCPTIESDSSAHSQHGNNAYYPQSSNGQSSQHSSSSYQSKNNSYSPLQFMRHVTPQTEAMKNRAAILPCKTRKTPEYTLVLDLDETLVHCSLCELQMRDYEFTFPIRFQNVDYDVYVKTRPYLRDFLERMCEHFEIIIFTASKKVYADKLISIIDPNKKLVRHRLFREHCMLVQGNYIKDLTILGRDLTKTIIVDNSPQAFSYHMDNGIPIESWYSNPEDVELERLEKYLYELVKFEDVRSELQRKYRIRDQVEGKALVTTEQLKQYF